MRRNLFVIGMLAVSAPCLAIMPSATPPAPPANAPQKWANPETKATRNDDSSGLRKGRIEKMNTGGGTFHVYGQRLTFDAKRVKVYGRNGKQSNIYALRVGSDIRFTLDATDPAHRRVSVIYLD
jgi:hypothetical protein